MYCIKCGKQLNENERFCSSCGAANVMVEQNNIQQTNNVQVKSTQDNANLLCILSLAFTYIVPAIIVCIAELTIPEINALSGLSPLAGLVLMIVARVKYPKSVFAKVVMWIYIANIILAIIGFILLVAFCYVMCGSCDELGTMGMILWR